MTQVIAIKTRTGIVLAADTYVLVGPPAGPFAPGPPEHKVFEVGGRFGVLSYGNGPPNHHVPTAITAHPPARSTLAMAKNLLACFGAHRPAPDMGLFVGGYARSGPVLVRVAIARREVIRVREPVACEGVIKQPARLPGWRELQADGLTLRAAAREAERLILNTAAEYPRAVGPPVEIVFVTAAGTQRHQ